MYLINIYVEKFTMFNLTFQTLQSKMQITTMLLVALKVADDSQQLSDINCRGGQ